MQQRLERGLLLGGAVLLAVWGLAEGRSLLLGALDRHAVQWSLEGAEDASGDPASPAPSAPAARTSDAAAGVPASAVREIAFAGRARPPDLRDWSLGRVAAFARSALHAGDAPPLALLEIPSASLSVALLDGTDRWTLNRGVGRIEGTAQPGDHGNVGIAGHRDGWFRALRHVAVGDVLHLTTPHGERSYRVRWIRVVEPDEVSVLAPTDGPALTLVTCHPFWYVGPAPQRFVVRATPEAS